MENGTIKFFDSRNNKRYGFIAVDGGGEIFFHYNDGQNFDGQNFGVTHGDQVVKFVGGRLGAEPKKGDRVMFDIVPGSKGRQKASPWGFENEYERAYNRRANAHRREGNEGSACEDCTVREAEAADTVYRVLGVKYDSLVAQSTPEVFFVGRLVALCWKYQRTSNPDIDPLFRDTKGYSLLFERKDGAEWKQCDDPR